MKLDQLLLGVLVFSVFIVTGVFIIGDINQNYDISIDNSSFSSIYANISEIYDISTEMKNKSIDADIEAGSEAWESMTKGSYSAVRTYTGMFNVIGNIINAIAIELGVPAYWVEFSIIALIITIIFALIYLFMRLRS